MGATSYQKMIVALLLMLFIGQVVASTSAPCESAFMNEGSHGQKQTLVSKAQGHSQHLETKQSMEPSPSCCPECDCATGGCFVALFSTYNAIALGQYALLASFPEDSSTSQLTTPLFRPPIAR